MHWIFQRSEPMGGATGEAYANTLGSPGMLQGHVLAREAIQNSSDAALKGSKVRVRFRATSIVGGPKKDFAAACGLSEIAERASDLSFGPNCLASLDDADVALPLLYVEDYETDGLSGDPHDPRSNFFRLLLSLGDRSKARTATGTGGSYGFGKSVYSSSSAIRTIFAYTRCVDGADKEVVRIFGCGYYKTHEFQGEPFSGRAWLGSKERPDGKGRLIVDPLEGGAAEVLAARLGFFPRPAGRRGTSILIVDSVVETNAIAQGVEDWWWPRLVANKLDVEIVDVNGNPQPPRPKKADRLRPFIEAFDIARGVATPRAGVQDFQRLNADRGVPMGTCGFVVIPLDDAGSPVVDEERKNTVALVRSPLMVVAYLPASQSEPPTVGVYLAPDAEEIDLALKKSEPPAHDRWDPDSMNLRDETGDGKRIVASILNRSKSALKRFQSRAAPAAAPKERRLTLLDRALGSYFRPQSLGPKTPPNARPSPLHLDFSKQPFAEATNTGQLRIRSAFAVTLDEASEEESVLLRLRINCPVLEDDGEEGEDLTLKVNVQGVSYIVDDADPYLYRFALSRGARARFRVETQEYNPAWSVRLRPDIDREERR